MRRSSSASRSLELSAVGGDGCSAFGTKFIEGGESEPGKMQRSDGRVLMVVVALMIILTVTAQESTTPCPVYKCAPDCVLEKQPNGCSTCSCPPTCEINDCAKDEKCVLEEVNCIRFPCFPVKTCVPRKDSCFGTPNTKRCGRFAVPWLWLWSYNSSANACQRFRSYGCTPSPNTFQFQRECEYKCKRKETPICIAMACAVDCFTLRRRYQCPRCICPNPCKGYKCSRDKVCQLQEVFCFVAPCDPQPFCVPKSCPTQEPCNIRCSTGLQTDKNGCQICKCL